MEVEDISLSAEGSWRLAWWTPACDNRSMSDPWAADVMNPDTDTGAIHRMRSYPGTTGKPCGVVFTTERLWRGARWCMSSRDFRFNCSCCESSSGFAKPVKALLRIHRYTEEFNMSIEPWFEGLTFPFSCRELPHLVLQQNTDAAVYSFSLQLVWTLNTSAV